MGRKTTAWTPRRSTLGHELSPAWPRSLEPAHAVCAPLPAASRGRSMKSYRYEAAECGWRSTIRGRRAAVRIANCRRARAMPTGLGGEGILPSLAPTGAHGSNPPSNQCALRRIARARCPRPQGPSLAVAARRLPAWFFLRCTLLTHPLGALVSRPAIHFADLATHGAPNIDEKWRMCRPDLLPTVGHGTSAGSNKGMDFAGRHTSTRRPRAGSLTPQASRPLRPQCRDAVLAEAGSASGGRASRPPSCR